MSYCFATLLTACMSVTGLFSLLFYTHLLYVGASHEALTCLVLKCIFLYILLSVNDWSDSMVFKSLMKIFSRTSAASNCQVVEITGLKIDPVRVNKAPTQYWGNLYQNNWGGLTQFYPEPMGTNHQTEGLFWSSSAKITPTLGKTNSGSIINLEIFRSAGKTK